MFKMGCSMARKILGPGSGNEQQPAGACSSDRKRGAAGGAESNGGAAAAKTGDELGDFSKLEEDPRLPLNVRQIFKITKSWKAIARTMSKTGTAMFLNLFEQNQDLFYLFDRFQHLKGRELHESMELREHAATVMSTLDQSINSLSDYDNFVSYLHSIGQLHRKVPGFKREYFWKIEQPFMKAVKHTLDERCNETIEQIYVIAIKLIIETIAEGYGSDADNVAPAANLGGPAPGGNSESGGQDATSGAGAGQAPSRGAPTSNENRGGGGGGRQISSSQAGGQQRSSAGHNQHGLAASAGCPWDSAGTPAQREDERAKASGQIARAEISSEKKECGELSSCLAERGNLCADTILVEATCELMRTTSSLLLELNGGDNDCEQPSASQWGRVLGDLSATLMMAECDDNQPASGQPFGEPPVSGGGGGWACATRRRGGKQSAARLATATRGAIKGRRRANTQDRLALDGGKIAAAPRALQAAAVVAKSKAGAKRLRALKAAVKFNKQERGEQVRKKRPSHKRQQPKQHNELVSKCPQTPAITAAARHAGAAAAAATGPPARQTGLATAAATADVPTSTSKSNWKSNLAHDGRQLRKLQAQRGHGSTQSAGRPTSSSTDLTGECVMAFASGAPTNDFIRKRSGCNDNNEPARPSGNHADLALQVTHFELRQQQQAAFEAPRDHRRRRRPNWASAGGGSARFELIKSAGQLPRGGGGGRDCAPTRNNTNTAAAQSGACKREPNLAVAAPNQNQRITATLEEGASGRQSQNNNKLEITTGAMAQENQRCSNANNDHKDQAIELLAACATGGQCKQDIVELLDGERSSPEREYTTDAVSGRRCEALNDSKKQLRGQPCGVATRPTNAVLHKSEQVIMNLLAANNSDQTDSELGELIKVLLLINRLSLTLASSKSIRRGPINDIESRLTSACQHQLTVAS